MGFVSLSWSAESTAELTTLYMDGYSASQIALKMSGVTRNAIIGKVYRLGLKRDGGNTKAAPRVPRPKPVRRDDQHQTISRIVRTNGNTGMRIHRSVETAAYKVRCIEIVPLNLAFDQLGPENCRYIYGDKPAEFVYCGHPKDGSSYCVGHHVLTAA